MSRRARVLGWLLLAHVFAAGFGLGCGLTCHPRAWLAGDPWCKRVCAEVPDGGSR